MRSFAYSKIPAAPQEWALDPQTDELVAALIAWHDDQLHAVPLAVFAEALERLERMRDGRSYDQPRRS